MLDAFCAVWLTVWAAAGGAGAGKSDGAMDAANLLKPALARGELRCIGATTLSEYRLHIEKDAAFERRFQQVMVAEPSVADTINILRGLSERYSSFHGVRIADRALVIAAELSDRYITDRFLPDKVRLYSVLSCCPRHSPNLLCVSPAMVHKQCP